MVVVWTTGREFKLVPGGLVGVRCTQGADVGVKWFVFSQTVVGEGDGGRCLRQKRLRSQPKKQEQCQTSNLHSKKTIWGKVIKIAKVDDGALWHHSRTVASECHEKCLNKVVEFDVGTVLGWLEMTTFRVNGPLPKYTGPVEGFFKTNWLP